jgi:hypothetical protein
MSTAVDPLEDLAAYREATRRIVRDITLDVRGTCQALLNLAERAKTAQMPEWARRAVYEEAREFLGVGPVPADIPGDAVEIAARSLRAKGYECCPTCARRLHGDLDFARWRDMRRVELEQTRAREMAATS